MGRPIKKWYNYWYMILVKSTLPGGAENELTCLYTDS